MAGRLKMNIFTTEPNDAPYSVMYCAMRKSVPEPIKTAENAQIAKRKERKTSRKIYLSRIRIFRRMWLSPDCFCHGCIRSILSFSSRLDKDAKEDVAHCPKFRIKI